MLMIQMSCTTYVEKNLSIFRISTTLSLRAKDAGSGAAAESCWNEEPSMG